MSDSVPSPALQVHHAGREEAAPACTVVVPLYNKARHIRQTLESVRAQRFTDFELIVVDDGSADGGDRVVEAFIADTGDSRLRLIRQSNAGVSSARNRGMKAARGRILFFLDADDLWHPDHMLAVVDAFERNPQVLLVGSSFRMGAVGDLAEAVRELPVLGLDQLRATARCVDDLAAHWLQTGQQGFNSSTAAVRASDLGRLEEWFPEGLSNGEDLDFWFRLNELGPLLLLGAELAVIGVDTDASVSRANRQSSDFPPYLRRMERRARTRQLRGGLNQSWLRFANHYESRIAISKVLHGHRRPAAQLLMTRWRAAASPMWWVALGICLVPLPLVRGLRRAYGQRGLGRDHTNTGRQEAPCPERSS